jgi:hypothetical protein
MEFGVGRNALQRAMDGDEAVNGARHDPGLVGSPFSSLSYWDLISAAYEQATSRDLKSRCVNNSYWALKFAAAKGSPWRLVQISERALRNS